MYNKHIMSNDDMTSIKQLTLAPYIQLSVSLIDKPRKSLGNMFRHQWATLAILIDYGYVDHILLKSSIIHDLVEDIEDFDQNLISSLEEGKEVLDLVLEVTKKQNEKKSDFLLRIMKNGSDKAKILKIADRISNLTDLGYASNKNFIERYLSETEKYILPFAEQVNKYMVIEMRDLILSRRIIAADMG